MWESPSNTKANLGFVLYDQYSNISFPPIANKQNSGGIPLLFLPIFTKSAAFPTDQSKPVFARNAPIKKTDDKNFKPNRIYYEPTSLGSKLSYSWLNSLFRKESVEYSYVVQSICSPKLKGLLYKRIDKDKMNGIGRLYIQLRYPWLNSFVRTISRDQFLNSPN